MRRSQNRAFIDPLFENKLLKNKLFKFGSVFVIALAIPSLGFVKAYRKSVAETSFLQVKQLMTYIQTESELALQISKGVAEASETSQISRTHATQDEAVSSLCQRIDGIQEKAQQLSRFDFTSDPLTAKKVGELVLLSKALPSLCVTSTTDSQAGISGVQLHESLKALSQQSHAMISEQKHLKAILAHHPAPAQKLYPTPVPNAPISD